MEVHRPSKITFPSYVKIAKSVHTLQESVRKALDALFMLKANVETISTKLGNKRLQKRKFEEKPWQLCGKLIGGKPLQV